MPAALGFAAFSPDRPLGPFSFTRRDLRADDVRIRILYCGVCHSDLHAVRGDWKSTIFPCVPGHEIVGYVEAVGSDVTRFKADDVVAVGCMVDSCRHCSACDQGLEQYCENGFVGTYNSTDKRSGERTYGGYSDSIVVSEAFVLAVRHELGDLAGVAPLLCAGITCWSPLCHWQAGPGRRVGIVGIGGLGHMGVKLARALGATVVAFTTSPGKRDSALAFGAHEVVVSTDSAEMAAYANSLDLIVNTVAAPHDLNPFVALLKRDGAMVLVGAPGDPHPPLNVIPLLFKRRIVAGSIIGGIAETQEMLDFCAEHRITSDVEVIAISAIEQAYDRMLMNDVKYRFVIDMASLDRG